MAERYMNEREMIFRKKGRKYIPVGWEFTGWPTDGFWLVTNGGTRSMHVSYLGEVPNPGVHVALAKYTDAVTRAYMALRDSKDSFSANDVAQTVIKTIATQLWMDGLTKLEEQESVW